MSDERITDPFFGRIAALYGLISEWDEMNGQPHRHHNHETHELLPQGQCPRCDWLHEGGPK